MSTAGITQSVSVTTVNSSSTAAVNTLDSDLKLSLSDDQIEYCSEALKFVKDKRVNKSELLSHEFDSLPPRVKHIVNGKEILEVPQRFSVAYSTKNMSKNRYTDVVPFDKNLVVLKPCKDYRPSATGYINASFISASPSESVSRFIATQGPLPAQGPIRDTYEEFWEMVLQYRCPVIVMLTPITDNEKKEKCGDYYQTKDGPREFGNICITTKSIKTTSTSLVLRNLEVNYKESVVLWGMSNNNKATGIVEMISESEEPPLSVLHILYLDWPDHGVPNGTLAFREIWRRLSTVPPTTGPILVHCSAGIGRTGTYCTVHNTIQRILIGDMSALDIVKTVTEFRLQRIGMVQAKEQYDFCYDAIIKELEDLISENGHKSS